MPRCRCSALLLLEPPSVCRVFILLKLPSRLLFSRKMMSSQSGPPAAEATLLHDLLPSLLTPHFTAFMFPSVPCTCPLEYLCIINDSATFAFRLCPSAPRGVTLGLACVEQHGDTGVKKGRGPLVDRCGNGITVNTEILRKRRALQSNQLMVSTV